MGDLRFARVWQKLCECYSNNGRSIERAYGYFSEIDNLYSNVVGGTTVQRIVFTNIRVERAEHRDALVAAATNKGIFYAVLTLTATEDVSVATGRGDWWQESLVFAGVDREDIFAQLFDDADRVDTCLEEEEEEPQEVLEEESPSEPEECEERRQLDAKDVPDVSLLETHPLLTEDMDVATGHYFDSSDEEEDDVSGNGTIAFRSMFQLDAGRQANADHISFAFRSMLPRCFDHISFAFRSMFPSQCYLFQLSSWTPSAWKSEFERATCTTTSAKSPRPSFAR